MNRQKPGYTYILFNQPNGTLYTGVTSNLIQRMYQHQSKTAPAFSKKYNLTKLAYFEAHNSIEQAIIREKQIKAGSRKQKLRLIEEYNPDWTDLSDQVL